jgi:hypothetical protein
MEVNAATTAPAPRLDVRQLAALGTIALGLVAVRAALREVHVPGHVALPTLFSLVLARSVAPGVPAATGVAATAGLVGAGFGMGLGIGGALTPLLAAAVVDAAGRFARPLFDRVATLALLGAVAAATRCVPALFVEAAASGSLAAALWTALPHAAFGALGAPLALAVARQPRRSARLAKKPATATRATVAPTARSKRQASARPSAPAPAPSASESESRAR